ncbi:hypothetical protein GGTG_06102 [Gaeumannomyces tritici R3-111a-1]|uniref:Uncharacterized protein n=1 Tax=Gaeumannomyces tritici (strain R3-111a-1) TaxID=644352 RepID=J3NXU7_GAET3|nr:hypothetical protein GGTG_06102 [Gaeumannomyces tritici R3-111a-1]EJT76180.1 hypothetical protein GGTG_06102 [Gaeumannomyces tritici R3-111a-1]
MQLPGLNVASGSAARVCGSTHAAQGFFARLLGFQLPTLAGICIVDSSQLATHPAAGVYALWPSKSDASEAINGLAQRERTNSGGVAPDSGFPLLRPPRPKTNIYGHWLDARRLNTSRWQPAPPTTATSREL